METLAVDLGRAIDLEIWHLEPEDGFYGPPPERVCRIMPQLLLTHLLTQALSERAEHHCPVCGRTFTLIYRESYLPSGSLFNVRRRLSVLMTLTVLPPRTVVQCTHSLELLIRGLPSVTYAPFPTTKR